MANLYKVLIVSGVVLILAGLVLLIIQKFNIPVGRLPGDIVVNRGSFTLYFPIATSILVSAILSLILYAISRR